MLYPNRFRYVVYLNVGDEFVNHLVTNLAKQWFNTRQLIPDLYGLYLQKELKIKDNQTFFPKEIIKYLTRTEDDIDVDEILGKNYAFVSINDFQMYYFFIRILDENTGNTHWRA